MFRVLQHTVYINLSTLHNRTDLAHEVVNNEGYDNECIVT